MSPSSPFVQLVDEHIVVTPDGEVDPTVRTSLADSHDLAISLLEVPHLFVDVSRRRAGARRSAGTVMDSIGMDTLAAALGTVNVGPGMGQQ